MEGIIAPNCVRYTINGAYAGRPVANILDAFLIAANNNAERPPAVADYARVLIQAWIDHIVENLADDASFSSCSWIDLNSANGTVGSTNLGLTQNFPVTGGVALAAMPGNVAFRVNKSLVAQRGQRQGRMYLVGVPEVATDTAPNTVVAATVTAVNADLASFLTDTNIDAPDRPLGYGAQLAVIHTTSEPNDDPPPKRIVTFDGVGLVQSLTLDPTLATQRRRLRG